MIDLYGRKITYMRLSVTDLCNLRCRYCMPEEGFCKKRHEDILSEDEMILAVQTAADLGITKLRITGGEPLVKKNILSICQRSAAIPGIHEVCITSNGILLSDMAKSLKDAGVKRINFSLDTLDSEKYAYISRIGSFDKAMRGLEAALSAGFDKIKINVVLVGEFNDDEIPALADLSRKYPLDVRFIELMPYDSVEFGEEAFIPNSLVLSKLPQLEAISQDDGVAKLYRLPDAQGNIGLISPVSAHFCANCNRIRLTADGGLKPCLHSAAEYNIKGMTAEQMREQFIMAIRNKPAQHIHLSRNQRSPAGRDMNQIGG